MLYACVRSFDVTGTVEIFLETKQGLIRLEIIINQSIETSSTSTSPKPAGILCRSVGQAKSQIKYSAMPAEHAWIIGINLLLLLPCFLSSTKEKKGVPSAVCFPHCAASEEELSLRLNPYPHKCVEVGARTRDLPVTDGRLYRCTRPALRHMYSMVT